MPATQKKLYSRRKIEKKTGKSKKIEKNYFRDSSESVLKGTGAIIFS